MKMLVSADAKKTNPNKPNFKLFADDAGPDERQLSDSYEHTRGSWLHRGEKRISRQDAAHLIQDYKSRPAPVSEILGELEAACT